MTPVAEVRAVLKQGWLDEHSPERNGFVLHAEGANVIVTVAEADCAGQAMPVVPHLSAEEARWLLDQAERELRAGCRFAVARRGVALLVGTDLVDVLGAALSDKPKRIQRKRTKGWRMPEGAVYVGRPSKWGNPFTIAGCIDAGFAKDEAQAQAVCVTAFRDWLNYDDWAAGSGASWFEHRARILAGLAELRGKDLACWCPEGSPCHGSVLLELANAALSEDQEATERGRHEIEMRGDAA